jgi:pimeloyl-ACP methyl ester carboxylesterase
MRSTTVSVLFLAAAAGSGGRLAAQDLAELRRAFDYDARAALQDKLTLQRDAGGVKTYDLVYASPRGGMVTGYLVVPDGKGPFAGIVFGHWGPGNATEFLPEAVLYAEAGAVSVLVDYPWVRPEPWRRSQGRGMKEPEKDRDSWVQAVVDLRRAFDLLESRPQVDRARLGYVGHSYGAQWGATLAAVDKRMKAAVLMGGVPDAESIIMRDDPDMRALREGHTREEMDAYFRINRPFDAIRYAPYAAPVPLLFQFARHERIFGVPDMERYYAAASTPKEVRWYETGHDLNDLRALADRAAWLGPRLALRPLRPLFEKRLEALAR